MPASWPVGSNLVASAFRHNDLCRKWSTMLIPAEGYRVVLDAFLELLIVWRSPVGV